MKRLCLTLVCMIWLSACVTTDSRREQGSTVFDHQFSMALQKALEKAAAIQKADNLSASLYISDRCHWQGTVGVVGQDAEMPVSTDTLYSFGSITKTFVAAIILQLVEESKLELEDSVGKWLSKFEYIDPGLTVRQLLNHGSGLYNFTENKNYWKDVDFDINRIWLPEDTLKYIGPPPKLGFNPPRYSNTNYILLGLIIEAVTKNSLSHEMHRRIIQPLAFKNTFLVDSDFDATRWANNTELFKSLYSSVWAAGAIASTAPDIARWSHTLYSGNFLSKASLNSMQETEVRRLGSRFGFPMGLGVWEIRIDGELAWGHGGHLGLFISRTFYLPEHKLSVAHASSGTETSRPRVPGVELVRTYLENRPDDISMCFDS